MFCPYCGDEVYLIEKIMTVKDVICDNCEKTFTIKDNGQANYYDIQDARRKFQQDYEKRRESLFESNESIMNKVISDNVDNRLISTKMYDPEWDRNIEAPGRIVYRG